MKKSSTTVAAAAVATMLLAGGADAAPISGTFVGANTGNTTAQGGGTWASAGNAAGHWWDQSGGVAAIGAYSIVGINDSGGFNLGNAGDVGIVTTISGLTPGAQYDVNFIWSGVWGWSNSFQGMNVGFDPGSTTILPGKDGVPFGSWVDEPSNTSSMKVWEDLIGTATADAGGNIEVYVNNVQPSGSYTSLQSYNGLSYTLVPEPGSLALLGLGGFALLRRRR